MAQTVEQLAETVGASVDRLLSQMKDAGLPHAAANEEVSEEDKQTLLTFLKRSHGESDAAPRKITLKRKQLSTLRTGGSGKRTVNVEVRKKRTYVKREEPPAEEVDESLEVAAAPEAVTEVPPGPVEDAVEAVEAAVESADSAEPTSADAALESEADVAEAIDDNADPLDPEVLRHFPM